MIHVRTSGSNWFIDEDTKRYLRMPLDETGGGRYDAFGNFRKDWTDGTDAPSLKDGEWIEFDHWEINPHSGRLNIHVGVDDHGRPFGASAPYAEIIERGFGLPDRSDT